MRKLSAVVFLLALYCVGAQWAVGQTPTGTITGTVVDQQGLPVEGAAVTLTNLGTNYAYKTATSSTGAYRFSTLDYGLYRVLVEAKGFRSSSVDNIKLDAATDFTVAPMHMEVGAATESITVEAGTDLVNTTNAEVSSTVEKKQIEELPILDRNLLGLLELEPGVNQNGMTTTVIDGQRTTYSNMTLDGINIQDNFIRENALDFSPNLPFTGQAQEFTVINQNSGSEYGGGASQVSIVTPKGTNTYHGEGFWDYRTNSWAANNWFNDASGVPLPQLVHNQGGGNIGGPIVKDKLFVYGYYELLRNRTQTPNDTTVLSPAIQAGLASPTPTLPFTYQPVDATTGAPVGSPVTVNLLNTEASNGNRDGVNEPLATIFGVDPAMLQVIQRVPNISNNTRVGDGLNLLGYQFNARSDTTQDNYGLRVDYDMNAHNTISATWAWNRQIVDRPDIDTSFDRIPLVTNNDSVKFLSTAWRWSPSGTVTNELRFGFDVAPAYFDTTQKFGSYMLDNTTLPFTGPDANFLPQGRDTHTWTGLDNVSWVKGNHTLKFGAQVSRITVYTTDQTNGAIYPTYGLGFSPANPTGLLADDFQSPSGTTVSNSAYNNANSLLASVAGILSSVSQTYYATSQTSGYVPNATENRNYRQNQFAVYAGDVWRLSPRLTVSYGLRWDLFTPVNEKDGLVLLPVVPSGSTVQQQLLGNATVDFAGGNSYRGLYNSYWKSFAPNLGVAWDPFGNGKTAVRAGFSINYVNDEFFTAANNAAAGNSGLSISPANSNLAGPTVSNPQGAQNVTVPPFQFPVTFAQNALVANDTTGYIGNLAGYGIDPNLKPPQIQQWSLSIQRDIGWNTSLQVSYVGNHGVGLFRAIDLNQLNFNANSSAGNFFQAFQTERACLLSTGNPCAVPNSVFGLIYGGGLGSSTVDNLIAQGQIGQLIALYHADEYDTAPGAPPGPQNLINFFPNPYIMGADLLKNTSFSSYNAGIVELRRRFSRGLYFQANYTYSKVMTDYGGSQTQFQPVQDNARAYLEKARAPFDLTNAFKANFTYELPIGKGHTLLNSGNKLLGLLADGWQTGSYITWQSGPPFSILSQYATFNRGGSRSYANTAVATLTHQQISNDLGVFVQPNGTVYLINPKLVNQANGTGAPSSPQLSCVPAVTGGFCNPQPGEVGNLQQYAFSGPAYFDWDISARKAFYVTEKTTLTFRTDAFNVLNHPTFAPPTDSAGLTEMNINSTTFGQSTSTLSTARILQMSLTLKF